jgi:hypothetical protein
MELERRQANLPIVAPVLDEDDDYEEEEETLEALPAAALEVAE